MGVVETPKPGTESVAVALDRSTQAVKRAISRNSRALTEGQRERVREAKPLEVLIETMHAAETDQAVRIDIAKFLTNKILPTPAADRPGAATDAEAAAWVKQLPSVK